MEKKSTARSGWGVLPFGFNLRPLRVKSPPRTMTVHNFHSPGPGYNIRYQDLREIHRAVVEGDAEKMLEIQEMLIFGLYDLNERDRKNRTALHLACAIGAVDMVKNLVCCQCQLNLLDGENRTALVKAVQCQKETCVDILLKKGADVNTKDFKGNTALHYAAYEENLSIARKLLFNKGDIEAKNKDGLTPLLVAVNEKKEKMVAFLVDQANINAVDCAKRSALHLACSSGHADIVKLLVDRKCQLNLCDGENRTALVKAVQCQAEACVTLLLEHGADPDLKDIKGNTALHYAAREEIVSIAEKLLLQNANIEAKNMDGLTPLLVAVNEKKEKMVAFLVEQANINAVDCAKRSALHLACSSGHADIVKLLVDRKCQLNLCDGENRTALVKAVQCQAEACVTLLLEHGADPDLKDIKGNTALHYAAREEIVSIAEKLLLQNANIEAKNMDGLTPLLVAVNEKKEKMVAFLVEQANINAVDCAKRSALHLACSSGHADIVKLLVDRKCQLNLCDGENRTALVKAVQCQAEACVTLLLEHGADPDLKDIKGNTALHYAAREEIVSIAEKLLLQNANIEAKNMDGLTPLLVAVNEKKEKMVAFLVEQANINAVDYAKRSALHLACSSGHADIVKLLVDRKCQLNLCDGENRTALVKAVQCQAEACVTLLLEHGADPDLKDIKGNTALHYAAREEIVSIAEKLLLQNANIEAKNMDGLTPLLVALNENKEQMVKFLVGKGARLLAEDTVKSSDQLISEHKEMKPENSSQNHDLVAKKSEEDSVSSLTRKADTDGSRPSKHEDLSSGTKTVPKLNLRKLMASFLRPKRAKCGLVSQEDRHLFADNNFAREDKTETLCKPSVNVSDYSPLAFVSPETPQTSLAMFGVTKEGATKPAIGKKDNGINIIKSPPQEQAVNDNLTSAVRAHKNHMSDRISALGRGEDSSPWDSESISARLPKKSVDCLLGAADQQGRSLFNEQVEDSPGKDLLHWESTTKVEDSVPNEAAATSDKQTPRSDLSSEPDLEVASEQKQEQERPDKSENNHPQDKVILQTCILAEKTSENQTKQINIPLVQLQNMAREPEMNMECDRQGDRSVHSEHPRVHKKYEEIQMKQDKLDWKNNVKRMSRELKQKIGKTCRKYRIITHPKLEPLRGNSKEADLKEIPPNLTKVTLDCEEKDEFGVSVSVVPQAFPEQKEPSLENAILSHSYSGSPDYACQSSSKLSFHENDNKPGEHVFNKNESLDRDPENKKVRNPLVTFEVKEDQEFDMQMAKSLNQNTTNSKLDTGYIPPYSDPASLFDLRLAHSNVAKQMIQKKRHDTSAITNTYKKTKPIRDSFQKPLYADNDSTNNSKSTEPALENVSSSPRPFRTSEVYQKEELQQDMQNLQRFKNEKGMLQVELLALEKEKVELQKQTGKERKQHKSSKMEGAENIYAAAAAPAAAAAVPAPAGLIQQRKSRQTDYHLFATTQNEDSDSNDPGLSIMEIKKYKNVKWTSKASVITPGFEEADSLTGSLLRVSNDNSLSEMDQYERRPAKKTSKEKNKVKKQVNSVEHLDDLTQSSEAASEDSKLQYSDYKSSRLLIELGMDCKDSVNVLTIRDAILKYERSIELKKKYREQLKRKILKVEYKVNGLEKLLSETKEMKSQLEHQKVEWERELYSLRLTLKQEKEKRRSAEMLYINIKEKLRSKEEQYSKEVEMKQQLQLNLRRRNLELKGVKNNLNQVSPPHEKEKGLLHENRMLQDEIAILRLEIDTRRNQKQEKEKRYFEDTEIEKEKNDSLQNAIKLNEVTLTNTVFQSSGQLNVVTAENTMLNSKLQDEKLNRERLEAKLQSYRARLATAIQDHDQSQASKRDLELAFQRAKDEWCHLQDKMNFEMSNLKENNEVISQQLSEAKSKFNALEIELQYTRDALREKTLALEHVQRNLKQTEDQKKEIEQKYQNEQDKVNKYIGKHESLEEKLSQLQSENMLLREELDDAYSRLECKEKTRIDLEDQVQVIVRNIQAESEKRSLLLQERNKELFNEYKHLMERVYTYEKDKEEREIGDLRARLETESRCLHLDAKNQVLQQELSMIATERECEKLKQIKKELEEKVVNLRSHAEVNVVEGSQVEKYYKWEIDQRARLIVEERLKEVNLFLQRQAASQENLEQLRASHDASVRSQVALRIKELESELQSKIRNSQELKIELENYRQLYLEESEMRMSLTKKLSKANERLEDITTKYLVERQQNRPFHSTLTMGPVLEGPYVGNLTSSLLLDRNVTPRENVMIPTSRPQTSVSSIETHLIKMLQEFEDNIIRELKEGARD